MSETINDETTDTLEPESQPDGNTVDSDTDTAERPKPNREARYRVERNEARAERDELAKQVRELQLRDAERLASRGLSEPADLFTLGKVELEDLLDDSGFVDGEKVQSVVSDILGSRPGLRTADRAVDRSQALGEPGKADLSWSDLLKAGVTD